MPNDRQFQLKTKIVATRDVKGYRATIPDFVRVDDEVLEIGCEWGTTTTVLAAHAGRVLGTDLSNECIERARTQHPTLEFGVLDAFDGQGPAGGVTGRRCDGLRQPLELDRGLRISLGAFVTRRSSVVKHQFLLCLQGFRRWGVRVRPAS